jgi:glycyl-tRNA synthetase (class II)
MPHTYRDPGPTQYDETGPHIGVHRAEDEVGTPSRLTVDVQGPGGGCVIIGEHDSMKRRDVRAPRRMRSG